VDGSTEPLSISTAGPIKMNSLPGVEITAVDCEIEPAKPDSAVSTLIVKVSTESREPLLFPGLTREWRIPVPPPECGGILRFISYKLGADSASPSQEDRSDAPRKKRRASLPAAQPPATQRRGRKRAADAAPPSSAKKQRRNSQKLMIGGAWTAVPRSEPEKPRRGARKRELVVKTIWDHSLDGELTFLAEYADDSEKSWQPWFNFVGDDGVLTAALDAYCKTLPTIRRQLKQLVKKRASDLA